MFDNIDIIYTHTDGAYEKAYEILQNQNVLPNITWLKETNFREQVLESMRKRPYTCQLVDDAILYRKVSDEEISNIYRALEDPDVLSFLSGVGKNTTFCYTANCQAPHPNFTNHKGYSTWNWREAKGRSEFRCPFMVVGNIYKTDTWFKYLDGIDPNEDYKLGRGKIAKCGDMANPNHLEACLQLSYQYSDRISEVQENKLAIWDQSCIVVHPMNLVQTVSRNKICGTGVEELNESYLNGKTFDLASFDFSNVYSMHLPFEYKMKSKS